MKRQSETQMVRLGRDTVQMLKQLQTSLDDSEGVHKYYARDWHGRLGLSLDAVVRVLIDRELSHRERSNRKRPRIDNETGSSAASPDA